MASLVLHQTCMPSVLKSWAGDFLLLFLTAGFLSAGLAGGFAFRSGLATFLSAGFVAEGLAASLALAAGVSSGLADDSPGAPRISAIAVRHPKRRR